ncbi:MAG: 4-(cytidine 5'-diphospho)-2-C-methyl-D-erythritol kinase [Hyphomicrobiales bacterium]|nr:4-(cytidine 5'-diphospho)-2-C-methyl-D-erythritol kinase [Hyphomicrobiales bacterium]MBV8826052.1 4-(cytidine 5'-diphospho)-2-C-methyl-D-erythritol kinase [Hyphomicrobiales bacterium]
MPPLTEPAPAKVNLTLRVTGRRPDGYHELESLVAFARVGDRLDFTPGDALALEVTGPFAASAGSVADNLVLKAARELARRAPDFQLGGFYLLKELPVAAGLGGGSADAAAALRLLARANALALDDPRIAAAASATGADVPVCVDAKPRVMRGIGEILSAPLAVPPLPAVLVNPGVPLATKDVFAAFARGGAAKATAPFDAATINGASVESALAALAGGINDLEPAAISLCPAVANALAALAATPDCRLARMSGSGATCFGLYLNEAAAAAASQGLVVAYPDWWVRATVLG